jgi:WD40 repeat protein
MNRGIVLGLAMAAAAFAADEPRLEIDSGGHQALIRFVSFTRDGKFVVSAGDDKAVRVWDVTSGKTVRKILGQFGDGDVGKIYAAALSPDEHYLAVGGRLSDEPNGVVIRIHDFRSGDVVTVLKGHTDAVISLAFSPDGHFLASGSFDKSVLLWDVGSWKQLKVLAGHRDSIFSVAFSPDNKRIVSASDDKTLRLWDIGGQMLKEMTGHQGLVKSARFSPGGRFIASGSTDRTVRLWDAATGNFIKELARTGASTNGISFSPDGRMLVTGGGDGDDVCRVFEVPSGRSIASFSGHKNIVLATAFSPDGKLVASAGGDDNEIRIWNPLNSQQVREMVGTGKEVWSVGFGRNSQSIAFGQSLSSQSDNNRGPLEKTILLDTSREHVVSMGEPVRDQAQFMRADDRAGDLSLTVKEGAAYQINVLQITRAGGVIHEIPRDNSSGYRHHGYSFSPDRGLIASGGGNGVLTIYATDTGKAVANCIGHTSDVWAVAFSPDGETLVSGSADQAVRLWDVSPASCKPLLTIFPGSDNEWAAWTPQGYYTSSANGEKYIGWRINQGEDQQAKFYPAAQFQKQFYRPDIVSEFLQSRDIQTAVRAANDRRGGEFRAQPVLGAADITASLPPMISISLPDRDQITVNQQIFTLRAEVLSNTLPIADVKVLQNGVQQAGKGGSPPTAGRRRRVEMDLKLEEGRNIISIIASNEKAMSEPETRTVIYNSGSVGDKPRLIALAIGISNYPRARPLKYADADANAMEAALKTQVDPQRILFGEVLVHSLTNEKATRGSILKELDWLSREGTQRDIRMLFLSGHGDVDSRKNYFFFAQQHDPDDYDLEDISWDLLIRKLTAPGGRALLLVDTCHAGALSAHKDGAKPLEQVIKEMRTEETGLVTFAASSGVEDSVEMDQYRHGAFTQAVLEGLAQGKADLNHDKVIETDELGTWITGRVRDLTSGKQHAIHDHTPGVPSFPMFRLNP